MYPSRAFWLAELGNRDCDPDDRAAPRDSAGGAGAQHAAARPVRARHTSADSTAGSGYTDRRPRS